MADDIDDLLDEVESKFLNKPGRVHSEKSLTKKKLTSDDELNSIIDDIFAEPDLTDSPRSHAMNNDSGAVKTGSDTSLNEKKCSHVYLGGSAIVQGLTSSTTQRSCDKLRCTSCDFKVTMFDNFEWRSNTDYLFLRNNTPDFNKLKGRLLSKKGCRAYCCQCSWRSIRDLTKVSDPDLKWVCGRH